MGKAGAPNFSGKIKKSKNKMYHQKQRGGGGRGRGGQRNTGWNNQDKGRRTVATFCPGMKGFLCFTNFHERDAVKEAYNLLNEYYESEDLVSAATDNPVDEGAAAKPVEEDDIDIEAAIKQEVDGLKNNQFRFKFAETGVRNVVFISTTINDPVKLAHKILEDVTTRKVQKSRFLLRMLPIETICKAELEKIVTAGKEIFEKHMKTGCNSYQITYKARHNSTMNREAVIKCLAESVAEVNPMNVVNLNDPKFSVIVEIVKGYCCLSVVTDFNKFRKYNLLEASSEGDDKVPKERKVPVAAATEEDKSNEETVAEMDHDEPEQDKEAEVNVTETMEAVELADK